MPIGPRKLWLTACYPLLIRAGLFYKEDVHSTHGLLKKLPDDATKYLNGVGSCVVPAGVRIVMRTGTFGTDYSILAGDADVEQIDLGVGGCPADADYHQFQIARKVACDDLCGDAKLLGIMLHFTTDAAVAA